MANAVVFADTLPSALKFESASTNIGSCTAPAAGSLGGTIICSVSSIAVSQTMLVTISAIPVTASSIADSGFVTFNGTDTNPANNSFAVIIQAK